MRKELVFLPKHLLGCLEKQGGRIVFAESCTGGLACVAMVDIPGASDFICGTTVAYLDQTKVDWLGVPFQYLQCHGAVSPEAVVALARAVLAATSEADF